MHHKRQWRPSGWVGRGAKAGLNLTGTAGTKRTGLAADPNPQKGSNDAIANDSRRLLQLNTACIVFSHDSRCPPNPRARPIIAASWHPLCLADPVWSPLLPVGGAALLSLSLPQRARLPFCYISFRFLSHHLFFLRLPPSSPQVPLHLFLFTARTPLPIAWSYPSRIPRQLHLLIETQTRTS